MKSARRAKLKQAQERIAILQQECSRLRARPPIATIDGTEIEACKVFITEVSYSQDAIDVRTDYESGPRYIGGLKSLHLVASGPAPLGLHPGPYALVPILTPQGPHA